MGSCESRPSKTSVSPSTTGPSMIEKSLKGVFIFSVNMVPFHFEPLCQLNLSEQQKNLLHTHWTSTLLAQKSDLFHSALIISVNQSPKMNDVIAADYNLVNATTTSSDLMISAKMERMANGVRDFFARQIFDNNLDSVLVAEESRDLGATHAKYAQFGFKPAFVDIWQSNMLKLLQELVFDDLDEKLDFVSAWRTMIGFVTELMMVGYDANMQTVRAAGRRRATIHEQIEIQNMIPRRLMSLA